MPSEASLAKANRVMCKTLGGEMRVSIDDIAEALDAQRLETARECAEIASAVGIIPRIRSHRLGASAAADAIRERFQIPEDE